MSSFDVSDYARLKVNYTNKIQTLSSWLWENLPKEQTIKNWLENYNSADAEREQLNALHLLSQFMSFELREIREMLRSLFRDHFIKPLIQEIKKTGITELHEIDLEVKRNLTSTCFIGIGNSSESSCIMLYFFRQENELKKDYFINVSDIFLRDKDGTIQGLSERVRDIKHFVFIDDFSGSGSQANDFFLNNQIAKIVSYNMNSKLYYFTLFSTEESNRVLSTNGLNLTLRSIFELDITYKVFSDNSRYYTNLNNEKVFSNQTCINYKDRYYYSDSNYLCGWRDGQLLLRFFYNTPDNTLPTFWTETQNWKPIFKRYDKKY